MFDRTRATMTDVPDLVVARAFTTLPEAHLARSVLDAVGIPSFLADENIIAADWLYSNAVGGVKLLVPSDLVDEAVAVLDTPATQRPQKLTRVGDLAPPVAAPHDACGRCGGTEFEPTAPGRRWAALTWLVMGVPLWRVRHVLRCRRCGLTFGADGPHAPATEEQP